MQSQQMAQKTYLAREALTAPPQKLQLLLIEAAIKNIHRTKMHWDNNAIDEAFVTLTRTQDIVTEILCSLDIEGSPEIAKSLASIYVFIFRKISAAYSAKDVHLLDDALKVLMAERESWREICEKFGASLDVNKKSATFETKTKTSNVTEKSPSPPQHEIKLAVPHIMPTKTKTPTKQKTEETANSKSFSWDA